MKHLLIVLLVFVAAERARAEMPPIVIACHTRAQIFLITYVWRQEGYDAMHGVLTDLATTRTEHGDTKCYWRHHLEVFGPQLAGHVDVTGPDGTPVRMHRFEAYNRDGHKYHMLTNRLTYKPNDQWNLRFGFRELVHINPND